MDLCLILWINIKSYSIKAFCGIEKQCSFLVAFYRRATLRNERNFLTLHIVKLWQLESALQGRGGTQKWQNLAAMLLLPNEIALSAGEIRVCWVWLHAAKRTVMLHGNGYNSAERRRGKRWLAQCKIWLGLSNLLETPWNILRSA